MNVDAIVKYWVNIDKVACYVVAFSNNSIYDHVSEIKDKFWGFQVSKSA